MTFQVVSTEGSVIVSCVTSIELDLIHTHRNLDEIPEEGSLIYSIADMPRKQKNKNCQAEYVHKRPKKPAIDVQSERSTMLMQHNKVKKPNIEKREDKFLCYDKNCQETKRPKKPKSVMWSVTKEENTDVWLPQPAIKSICRDKTCQ